MSTDKIPEVAVDTPNINDTQFTDIAMIGASTHFVFKGYGLHEPLWRGDPASAVNNAWVLRGACWLFLTAVHATLLPFDIMLFSAAKKMSTMATRIALAGLGLRILALWVMLICISVYWTTTMNFVLLVVVLLAAAVAVYALMMLLSFYRRLRRLHRLRPPPPSRRSAAAERRKADSLAHLQSWARPSAYAGDDLWGKRGSLLPPSDARPSPHPSPHPSPYLPSEQRALPSQTSLSPSLAAPESSSTSSTSSTLSSTSSTSSSLSSTSSSSKVPPPPPPQPPQLRAPQVIRPANPPRTLPAALVDNITRRRRD